MYLRNISIGLLIFISITSFELYNVSGVETKPTPGIQPCDESDLNCEDDADKPSSSIEGNDEDSQFDCDTNDPICQKFQMMLEEQIMERKGPGSGKQKKVPAKCNNKQDEMACKAAKKTCYTDKTCGDLLEEDDPP